MGGHCSQKAHALEGTAILSRALRASGSVRIKTLSQRGLARRAGRVQYENGRQSGGGLWWRPTRRGIAGRRLIKTMGLGAKPTMASPRRFNPKPNRIDRSAYALKNS